MKIRKAVIPAAGFGTRFLPITKSVPKELLPIIDKPALAYIVEEAISAGLTEIVIIISEHKEAIKDYFNNNIVLEQFLKERNNLDALKLIAPYDQVNIQFVIQKEQLGLGHAIFQTKKFIAGEPFAVLLGDDLFYGKDKAAISELIDVFNNYDGHILGTMSVPLEHTNRYGIVKPVRNSTGPVFEIDSMIEKPNPKEAPSRSAVAGRYILKPEIFKFLEVQQKGIGNEIQLTDAIISSMSEVKVFSYDLKAIRYDIGSKEGYLKAIIDFASRRVDLKDAIKDIINIHK